MWLIVVIIIGLGIWAYSSAKKSEREQAERRKKREREDYVKRNFPNAYKEYWGKQIPTSYPQYRGYSSMYVRRGDENCSNEEWKVWEDRLLTQQRAKKEQDADKKWESDQSAFATMVRNKSGELMPSFGNYTYQISTSYINKCNLNFKVWQHFTFSACLENDLDYTLQRVTKINTDNLVGQRKNGLRVEEKFTKPILNFLTEISKGKTIMLLYNTNIKHWEKDAALKTYNDSLPSNSFIQLAYQSKKWYYGDLWAGDLNKTADDTFKGEPLDIVVILDACTTNEELEQNCKHVITQLKDKRPLLTYISFVKCYSRAEMIDIIEKSKVEAEKKAAEEKAKEEERKRREAEELAEKKRKEEERDNLKKEMQAAVANNKIDWVRLNDDFYCTGFLNTRNLLDEFTIKYFRNESDDFLNHERVLCSVIPKIKERLIATFGEGNLKTLTLFCVPASSKEKDDMRYEDFPNRLCDETGMGNAYNHVRIVQNGMSKKDPRNTTGKTILPIIEYDKDFFKDRIILLFDDVVISGDTMLGYKDIIEKMGATVIAGISLGKPRHRINTSLVSAEARARLQGTAKKVLINNVKDWEHLYGDFYYTWLFYYYPTNCDFEASESEWFDRRLVWNFKNDPDKNISSIKHEDALDNLIPQIRQRLCDSFGEEYLQFLTLVCLPASTKIKNDARYDEFAQRLCEETGMENGYPHVHIVKDGMSKNDTENTTKRSIPPEVSFDDWFEGKYVLLFDDVITKGRTMLRYKDLMERMGATVIGGFTIGKTKHERPERQRFVPIEEPPHIFNSGDELPF